MTLRFYDFEFNLLYIEPKVIRSSWTVYYNDVGRFEAHLPLTSEATRLVMENRYLIVVQKGLCGIVVAKELRDELIIYARTCNWLLSKRITPEFSLLTGNPAELASGFAETAFSDVENFVLGETADCEAVYFESSQKPTLNVITDCLKLAGLGHSLVYDISKEKWVFNILNGKENELIMSEGNKNAYDTRICADILDLATCGRYDMETEDGYVSTTLEGDAEKQGIYRWEAELSGKNRNEATVSLSKLGEKNEVTLKAQGASFGKDYELGDIVRVQIIKGACRKTVKKRICGVEVRFEHGVSGEQPIFEDV